MQQVLDAAFVSIIEHHLIGGGGEDSARRVHPEWVAFPVLWNERGGKAFKIRRFLGITPDVPRGAAFIERV